MALLDMAGEDLEKKLAKLSPLGQSLRELYLNRAIKCLTEVLGQLLPLLGNKADRVQFSVWETYQTQQEGSEMKNFFLHPNKPDEKALPSATLTVIRIFHSAKPEHFCNLLPAPENAVLEKLNRGVDTSFFEGTVKLDPASKQAWNLVDYGQFAHGRCRGSVRTPVLPRDEFLNKVCKALYVDGASCVVCQNCCAMTSTLVGLLEANVFSEQELLSMLVKAVSAE